MENTLHIQVLREGEPDPDFAPPQPTILESAVSHVRATVARASGAVALQVRMAAYDARHGTHYRQIRNELVREQKQRQFEQKIGLTACN